MIVEEAAEVEEDDELEDEPEDVIEILERVFAEFEGAAEERHFNRCRWSALDTLTSSLGCRDGRDMESEFRRWRPLRHQQVQSG